MASFNLKDLIKSETSFTKSHKSLINLLLTNKPLSFQNPHLTEINLSDYHKFHFVNVIWRSNTESRHSRLKLKVIATNFLLLFLLQWY